MLLSLDLLYIVLIERNRFPSRRPRRSQHLAVDQGDAEAMKPAELAPTGRVTRMRSVVTQNRGKCASDHHATPFATPLLKSTA